MPERLIEVTSHPRPIATLHTADPVLDCQSLAMLKQVCTRTDEAIASYYEQLLCGHWCRKHRSSDARFDRFLSCMKFFHALFYPPV